MAPIWFDEDNFWREKGAHILAAGGGSIAVPDDINRASVTIPWHNTAYLYCGAGTVNGELTPPDDPHFGYEPPILRITAGRYDDSLPDGKSAILGRHGLQPYEIVANITGTVGLQADASDDLWIGAYPNPGTGYPSGPEMQYLSIGITFRKNKWSDGRSVFVGDWYVELYEYDESFSDGGGPGNGTTDPHEAITCPVRPPWPYRDPIRNVSAPDSAQIRRSRP